jgi:hypothetical protein
VNATLQKSIAVYVAALAVGVAIAAAANPSAASPPVPSPQPVHVHHGFGPAAGIGLVGTATVVAFASDSCLAGQPIYDRLGNFLGRQVVDVCD